MNRREHVVDQPASHAGIVLDDGTQILQCIPGDRADLVFPVQSGINIQEGSLSAYLNPCQDLLYRPLEQRLSRPIVVQGWRLQIDPNDLCRAAVDLSGHALSPRRCQRHLQKMQVVQPRLHPESDQIQMLHQLLKMSQSPALSAGGQLRQVGLDSLIIRMAALLLCGQHIQRAQRQPPYGKSTKGQIMEELIEWIQDNLHRPIQIKDLCQVSGYSERSLRNQFQARFGSAPVQWVRLQRLKRAREELLQSEGAASVTAVANSVGYQHLSQFSRDFQLVFGRRPSELLREARRA
jgi:AraC-like DNA-binding protein